MKIDVKHNFLYILCAFCLAITIYACDRGDTLKPFPFAVMDTIGMHTMNEPSGIDFHTLRNTLFVVGDEGYIYELSLKGKIIKQHNIEITNLEGITHNPLNGLLYCAVEGKEQIVEIDPDTLKPLRLFSIPRKYNGKTVMKKGGKGIEAITFVPDSSHHDGGTFFVANQSFNLDDCNDLSALFELTLPLKSKDEAPVTTVQYFEPDMIDLSGLYFNKTSGYLMVISDEKNTLLEISLTGKIENRYFLPGDGQEGITIDNNGLVYIAQDSGGILRMRPLRK